MKKNNIVFGKVKTLCACALLCAAAVSIAYICKFLTFGSVRITFENLPIILAGIFFGPVAGLMTGLCADLVSTAVSFYGLGGLNPLITLGAGCVGLVAGLLFKVSAVKKDWQKALLAASGAHVVGNMIVKSIGLKLYFNYALPLLLLRVPTYILIGAVEFVVILILIKNKGIIKTVGKLR